MANLSVDHSIWAALFISRLDVVPGAAPAA